MTITYGEFEDNLPPSQERLTLQFSPSSIPLQQRWRNNGLSADFMADYLMTFFLGDATDPDQRAEIKSATSYIANELIENAMKFHDQSSQLPICITLTLYAERLIFRTSNAIGAAALPNFQSFLDTLFAEDPQELYFRKLEESALEDSDSSGLGILTMMNDYMATLGWKFESSSDDPTIVMVTTVVQLDVGTA